jgi:hypothetical protein
VEKKIVLIIIDKNHVTNKFAETIAAAFKNQLPEDGYLIKIIYAADFCATDLLPAHFFLLGCEKPEPPEFMYIKDLFEHINLAGRSCLVCSSNKKSIEYICGLVNSAEARLCESYLFEKENPEDIDIQNRIKNILKQEEKNGRF